MAVVPGCSDSVEGNNEIADAETAITAFTTATMKGEFREACALLSPSYEERLIDGYMRGLVRISPVPEQAKENIDGVDATCEEALAFSGLPSLKAPFGVPHSYEMQQTHEALRQLDDGYGISHIALRGATATAYGVAGVEQPIEAEQTDGEWLISKIFADPDSPYPAASSFLYAARARDYPDVCRDIVLPRPGEDPAELDQAALEQLTARSLAECHNDQSVSDLAEAVLESSDDFQILDVGVDEGSASVTVALGDPLDHKADDQTELTLVDTGSGGWRVVLTGA